MNILYVCTEVYPLLKTGGLADVSAALSAALRDLGWDVRLLLPGFAPIAAGFVADGPPLKLSATGGPEIVRTLKPAPTLLPGTLATTGQPAYLLDAPAVYHRDGGPYLDAQGNEWPDNAQRFALLAWAAAGLGCGGDPSWRPDVVHAHDWHAGLAPLYLLQLAGSGPRPATVFTVHNLAYQGLFGPDTMAPLGLAPSLFRFDGVESHGHVSFMKAGLQFADAITTVSPRYAREIMTPEQGCGLDGVLRYRADQLTGILADHRRSGLIDGGDQFRLAILQRRFDQHPAHAPAGPHHYHIHGITHIRNPPFPSCDQRNLFPRPAVPWHRRRSNPDPAHSCGSRRKPPCHWC